ncbi:GNAT family N-acetyltransferase [Paenibacillus bouchesdurhonensis]|uniref:GNAT family N-acetyltransferase n=1 Tax=Paenibacillus bouchesdurhonensis TaxID=1870990 RepID=UPI000DA63A7E|nr:GNAT family N-acetyltransferase [Paenibacillus bouchesdurhonensis]
MNIREFRLRDLEPCAALFIEVFNQEPWNDRWSAEKAEIYLKDFTATPGFIGIVAEDNENNLVGLMFGCRRQWWSGDEFWINEMCVDRSLQQSGIGSAMLRYLESTLACKGIENMVLLTNRGIPAEDFYRKNGFGEISRIIFLDKGIGAESK